MDEKMWALLVLGLCVQGVRAECDLTGPVVGAVFGTLGFVLLVLLIVWLVLRAKKRRRPEQHSPDAKTKGFENAAYARDVEAGPSAAPARGDYAAKGFGGYVDCVEYESPTKKMGAPQIED